MVYGTPEYMAPEQALGQSVTPSADIYALGVMMFEMLSGVRPFDHESKVTLLGMHVTAPIPTIAQKAPSVTVEPEVEAVVRRMLAKESADRYKDAKELIDALDGIWTGDYGALPGSAPGSIANPRASLASAREVQRSNPGVGATALATGPGAGASPSEVGGRGLFPLDDAGSLVRRATDGATSIARRVEALVKEKPKVFLAAGLGATTLLGAILLVAVLLGGGDKPVTQGGGATDPGEETTTELDGQLEPEAPAPDIDAKVAEAYALVEKGDFGTGIDKLTTIAQEHPNRADVHRALQKAYSATKNVKESMRHAELWLDADASGANDPKLHEDVRNAAIGTEAQNAAFALLEKKMGTAGPDILYDIAYGRSGAEYPAAATRGRRAVTKAEVRALASPELLVALDLRSASSCESKRNLFPRVREVGDVRSLLILRPYTATRGCGFAQARDCWPCMRAAGALSKTIAELEARSKKL